MRARRRFCHAPDTDENPGRCRAPASTPDAVAAIRALTGRGVDFSFDTTGVPAVLRAAVDALAPRGTCGFVGSSAFGAEVSLDMVAMMTQGKKLRGIVEGDANPDVFIPALIALHGQGRFPFDKLIQFYPFEQINQAIDDMASGKVLKPVLRMPS